MFKAMNEMFADLIGRFSKYDLNVSLVVNDIINSITGR